MRLVQPDDGPALSETVTGPRWVTATHGFDFRFPVLVRPGTVLPVGARTDRPDYAWADGVTLHAFELPDGYDELVVVPPSDGAAGATFRVRRSSGRRTFPTDFLWGSTPPAYQIEAAAAERPHAVHLGHVLPHPGPARSTATRATSRTTTTTGGRRTCSTSPTSASARPAPSRGRASSRAVPARYAGRRVLLAPR